MRDWKSPYESVLFWARLTGFDRTWAGTVGCSMRHARTFIGASGRISLKYEIQDGKKAVGLANRLGAASAITVRKRAKGALLRSPEALGVSPSQIFTPAGSEGVPLFPRRGQPIRTARRAKGPGCAVWAE